MYQKKSGLRVLDYGGAFAFNPFRQNSKNFSHRDKNGHVHMYMQIKAGSESVCMVEKQ